MRGGRPGGALAAVFGGLTGCASITYSPIDLQLDVVGAVPNDAQTIDMCVEGAGLLSEGAGNGRVMFAGLPADVATTVTLDFTDTSGAVIGGVGPVVFDVGTAWVQAPQDKRTTPCAADGQPVSSDEASWVLGTRFTSETW